MNTPTQYDNQFSNGVLLIIGTLVRTVERAAVVFFDGLRNATERGTPSVLGFVSAFLPILTPLPVAAMTAFSLETYLGWERWQALVMAIGIEGAGFVLWVTLTEELMKGGWKGTVMQFFFAGAVLVYQTILITINAVLASIEGQAGPYVLILFLACIFPALSAVSYGYRNHSNTAAIEREREAQKQLDEKIRQEKREDRKELQRLKLGFASEVQGVELEQQPNGAKFRKGKVN